MHPDNHRKRNQILTYLVAVGRKFNCYTGLYYELNKSSLWTNLSAVQMKYRFFCRKENDPPMPGVLIWHDVLTTYDEGPPPPGGGHAISSILVRPKFPEFGSVVSLLWNQNPLLKHTLMFCYKHVFWRHWEHSIWQALETEMSEDMRRYQSLESDQASLRQLAVAKKREVCFQFFLNFCLE